MISLSFLLIGMVLSDFNKYYSTNENVSTSFINDFDYSKQISGNTSSIQEDLTQISSGSGITVLTGGIALISAVVKALGLVLQSVGIGFSIISKAGFYLGIETAITSIFIVILLVVILFAIVSAYHRYKT